jgi:mRNA interferase MazF
MTQKLNQGEVWLANLNPGKGTEPGKTRPVLIIQDQALLDIGHPSTLILPLTTHLIEMAFPLRVRLKAQDKLEKNSDLLVDQIRAIDNKRLVGEAFLTQISEKKMIEIQQAICDVMGVHS